MPLLMKSTRTALRSALLTLSLIGAALNTAPAQAASMSSSQMGTE